MTTFGRNAREAMYARSPDEIYKNSLHTVVTMVGHTDAIGLNVMPKLLEITVAQHARSHLYAYLMKRSISSGIEMGKMYRHLLTLTEPTAESLITVGFGTSKTEIAMGCFDAKSCLSEEKQQSYTVGTPKVLLSIGHSFRVDGSGE